MILSHKYKFIFIKTAKTAGTSIEAFLSRHCGASDVVTPIEPPVEGHQPRNYLGFINPIHEILERPGKIFAALRHSITSREKFYRHMPAFEVQKRVPCEVWNSYFKFCVERNPWDKVLSHYHMHAAREGGSLSLDEYLARRRFPINFFRYTDRSGKKNIIRVNSRYSRADLFRLLFVSIRVHSWLVPLRREGRNDLFKARIAAQRIPKRQ